MMVMDLIFAAVVMAMMAMMIIMPLVGLLMLMIITIVIMGKLRRGRAWEFGLWSAWLLSWGLGCARVWGS